MRRRSSNNSRSKTGAAGCLAAVVLGLLVSACGGSSGSSPNDPPPATTNPCATAALEEEVVESAGPDPAIARAAKTNIVDGNPRWRVLDALWTHRESADRGLRRDDERRRLSPSRSTADVGDIAVIQDEGDLILPPNTYDLRNLGLRFTRNNAGGYNVTRVEGNFRGTLGTRLTLTDDDSSPNAVPFAFPFYGASQTAAFVNSDGNITFEEADKASTERNVARMLTGPPRVSPFLADLDPTTGTGRVFAHAASDQYTVTWCNVRGFDSARTVTAQATLLPSGVVEMVYAGVTVGDAIVGLSPGRTGVFTIVNLSDAGPTDGGPAAVGERFAQQPQIDLVALTRKFYSSHDDNYDQLVLWTDTSLITNAFAYETTVKNEVTGLGIDTYDLAGDFGSAGRLRSLVVMDWVGKYPDNPAQKFLGENNTVGLLGQESGHRWLAFLEFRDRGNGIQRSDALLGRDLAHWSFFFDSDGSVMEGNDIEDLGGGSFRTVGAVQRYSLLDQYAMGLIPPSRVPPFFYVENPTNMSANRTAGSSPEVGVTFNGTKREILIQDILEVHGERSPSAADSARIHRQAFIFMVSAGRAQDAAAISKIDLIRRSWETFFLEATDRRMRAITALR